MSLKNSIKNLLLVSIFASIIVSKVNAYQIPIWQKYSYSRTKSGLNLSDAQKTSLLLIGTALAGFAIFSSWLVVKCYNAHKKGADYQEALDKFRSKEINPEVYYSGEIYKAEREIKYNNLKDDAKKIYLESLFSATTDLEYEHAVPNMYNEIKGSKFYRSINSKLFRKCETLEDTLTEGCNCLYKEMFFLQENKEYLKKRISRTKKRAKALTDFIHAISDLIASLAYNKAVDHIIEQDKKSNKKGATVTVNIKGPKTTILV